MKPPASIAGIRAFGDGEGDGAAGANAEPAAAARAFGADGGDSAVDANAESIADACACGVNSGDGAAGANAEPAAARAFGVGGKSRLTAGARFTRRPRR